MPEKTTSGAVGPSVSVVVAAYNVEQWIEACIQSLEAQTYDNLEIVVTDDGSTDQTGEIIANLAALRGSRVRVLTQENQGLSQARNNGLKFSKGDLVVFVDGDDLVAPTFVECLVRGIVDRGATMSSCAHCVIDPTTAPTWPATRSAASFIEQPTAIIETLYGRIPGGTSACAKMAPRAVWESHLFPPGLYYEDLATVPGLVANANSIAGVDDALYGVRIRANSITRQGSVTAKQFGDLAEAIRLCVASEPGSATSQVRAAYRARHAQELCRLVNLAGNVDEPTEDVADAVDAAHRTLSGYACKIILDRSAPAKLRLRVALMAVSPKLYALAWGAKKRSEGWL